MTRFIARHPLLTYALWILPETLALLAFYHLISDNLLGLGVPLDWIIIGYAQLVTGPMTVAIVLPVALLRLRAGAKPWPVLLLPFVAPIHGFICWAVTSFYVWAIDGASVGEIIRGIFRADRGGLWSDGYVVWSLVAKTLIAGATVGVCLLIARHKRRSGRWETIVPVAPGGRSR